MTDEEELLTREYSRMQLIKIILPRRLCDSIVKLIRLERLKVHHKSLEGLGKKQHCPRVPSLPETELDYLICQNVSIKN